MLLYLDHNYYQECMMHLVLTKAWVWFGFFLDVWKNLFNAQRLIYFFKDYWICPFKNQIIFKLVVETELLLQGICHHAQFSTAFLAYLLRLDCVWKENLDKNILSVKLSCPCKAPLAMFLFQLLSSVFCPELTFMILWVVNSYIPSHLNF